MSVGGNYLRSQAPGGGGGGGTRYCEFQAKIIFVFCGPLPSLSDRPGHDIMQFAYRVLWLLVSVHDTKR